MDDGATEVVELRARRRASDPIDGEKVARTPAGGRMAALTLAGDAARRDFIILRKANAPALRITLTQAPIFKVLWQLWQVKRLEGAPDAGITVAEVSDHLIAKGTPAATSSISTALRALSRNNVVRVVTEHVGWRAQRSRFYPTSAGIEVFAMAEVLGDGAFVQVGRSVKAWRGRSEGEPSNLFQHAELLRGWADPVDPAESA